MRREKIHKPTHHAHAAVPFHIVGENRLTANRKSDGSGASDR